MSGASSSKKLLTQFNSKQYNSFILNEDEKLELLVISSVPGVSSSELIDTYLKTISHPGQKHHVKFITKNGESHSFAWQTTPEQLKKAVRWGIINTHSITSKVISTLGKYRIVTHERIAKGMVSNSQEIKLKLLDLYQDRFEALHDLESLVNKDNSVADYKTKLTTYLNKLEMIQANLTVFFAQVSNCSGLNQETIEQIKNDLKNDIDRTNNYLTTVQNQENLHSFNRARGPNSILEFVKQQMTHGLYELQGINQDITYSTDRYFALTRGEMNGLIEDARKVIDDHQADIRNAITDAHHGLFSKNNEQLVTYDFSEETLTPQRQGEILLGISFIEEWDKVDIENLSVSNKTGTESLDVINATKWKNHRNITTFLKSTAFFILNFFKSIILPTKAWEEESWTNKNFHLVATDLRKHITLTEPMWQKPIKLFKQIGYALFDLFKGARNFSSQLSVKMPEHIINDWNSCDELSSLDTLLQKANKEIKAISKLEKNRLNQLLEHCNVKDLVQNGSKQTSQLARVEYALTAGEQNDLLTSMTRGLNEFASVFTHNLYTKDPLAGIVFSAVFAVGAGVIYLPGATASVFGSAYVNWFSNFSYSMGSSKLAAVVSGGSTQAQLCATGLDALIHGPSGIATKALYRLGEDPLTVGAYLAAATGLGYVLVNGIDGYAIPLISDFFKEDLGTVPEASYPFIGAKFGILLYEGLMIHKNGHDHYPEFSQQLINAARTLHPSDPEQQKIIDRFIIASWLSKNATVIAKINEQQRFELSRHIEILFDKDQSKSLNKLLYPEVHYSIAFQIFSIPLSYIPAIFRFGTSLILSAYALTQNKTYPFEPIKRAASDLWNKVTKDLSRLIVFSNNIIKLIYTGLTVLPKAIAYTLTMFVGRIAGLFDAKPAHAIHKIFAAIHTSFKYISELFYPVRALKSIEVANPIHTINAVEGTYSRLLGQMDKAKPAPQEQLKTDTNPAVSCLLFCANKSPQEMPLSDITGISLN
jgi:hypothetical protein